MPYRGSRVQEYKAIQVHVDLSTGGMSRGRTQARRARTLSLCDLRFIINMSTSMLLRTDRQAPGKPGISLARRCFHLGVKNKGLIKRERAQERSTCLPGWAADISDSVILVLREVQYTYRRTLTGILLVIVITRLLPAGWECCACHARLRLRLRLRPVPSPRDRSREA